MRVRVISFVIVSILSLKQSVSGQQFYVEKKFHVFPYSYTNSFPLATKSGVKSYSFSHEKAGQNITIAEKFKAEKWTNGTLNIHQPVEQVGAAYNLPSNLFVQQLGFVCLQEYKLEKVTSIPFRFRLGSLAYTDYMERKPNALKPN